MSRGLPFGKDPAVPAQAQIAAVTQSSTTVATVDAGIVPTLVNVIGSDGLESETRAKLNELIAAHEDLRVRFNDLISKAQAAGHMAP